MVDQNILWHPPEQEIRKILRKTVHHGMFRRKLSRLKLFPGQNQARSSGLAVREVVHGRPLKKISALANPEALEHFADIPDLQEN